MARGRPGRPATGGMPSIRLRVWVMSLTLAAVVMTRSGVPRPSQIKWCLLPAFRRSTGDGPVAAPSSSRVRESRPRARPVEFACRVQFGEHDAVQLLDDSGLRPAAQASPTGLSGAEPELWRQELPGDVLTQNAQDALQAQPVWYRSRSW